LDDADMMVAVASASKIEEALSELEEGAAEESALVGEGEGDEPELSVERGKKDEDEE
jgi:hypothetical protein